MHSEHVVHLVRHNGKRSDDSNILSHQIYQKVFSLLLVLALGRANVVFHILYKANRRRVSKPGNDSHQEQEQLSSSHQCMCLVF